MKSKLVRLIFAYSILMFGANMIHPITPTIMTNLNVPDYLFGYAFAAMSLASFLLSPFWGKLSDLFGRKKILTIGLLGYIVGQWFFAFANTAALIMLARVFAGLFVGGFSVSALAMVSDEQKGSSAKNLTLFTTITALAGTLGYFAGGVIGVYSIPLTFIVQSIALIIALSVVFTIPEQKKEKVGIIWKEVRKAINPFHSFKGNNQFSKNLWYLLAMTFFLNTAMTMYDNSFNYYIKDILELSSAYNGMIKGVVGIVSVALNMTLLLWMIRRFDVKKNLLVILSSSILMLVVVLLPQSVTMFIVSNIIFLILYSASLPLQQASLSNESSPSDAGVVFGLMASLRSMGGVFGSVLAGSFYVANAQLPFIGAAICLFFGLICLWKGRSSNV